MEGVGSRLGRASSRYGPSATAAVFNGPVRKWKRKWVHVSPSPTGNSRNSHSHSQSNGHSDPNNNNNNGSSNSRLLLCRWTPLSSASPASNASSEEPPKRKFRYTPIAVLEEQRRVAKKVENEVKTSGTEVSSWQTSNDEEQNDDNVLKQETQDAKTSHLDLGLCLKGHNSDHDFVGEDKEEQAKKASSGGFWTIG